eukprot:TRINITY_DN109031_c0_g1_i1.p1 TRINITY_DN109031_c0_g1~~TRINITY_DN109031_c0_g1_i1.p1  ORF type:complete len:264 (+),score=64.48 TRINITY_DN109031_c0_g1_i1:66-857(+)
MLAVHSRISLRLLALSSLAIVVNGGQSWSQRLTTLDIRQRERNNLNSLNSADILEAAGGLGSVARGVAVGAEEVAGGLGSVARGIPAGNEAVVAPSAPASMPSTDLEAEVQRTSQVAAYLAQDAALLSKELQSLQGALRAPGRRPSPMSFEEGDSWPPIIQDGQDISALEMKMAAVPAATSDASRAAAPAAATPAAAPPPPVTPAPSGEMCGSGADQVTCGTLNKIITFGYHYPLVWGIINWALIWILAFLTCWCCCICCGRS